MVFWHHLYQILSLKQSNTDHIHKFLCSKIRTSASIIHTCLNKGELFCVKYRVVFKHYWGQLPATTPPLVFQWFGSRSAVCSCKGSLGSTASHLKLQICSGGCGLAGMRPQTHNLHHSLPLALSYTFTVFFFPVINSLTPSLGHEHTLPPHSASLLPGDGNSLTVASVHSAANMSHRSDVLSSFNINMLHVWKACV